MRSLSLAAVLALVLTLIGGALTPARAAAPLVISEGHVDMFRLAPDEAGGLALTFQDSRSLPAVQRNPEDVVLKVNDAALRHLPDGFPGAPRAWALGQSQEPGLVWPGWETLEMNRVGMQNAAFDITWTGPEGAEIHVFKSGPFGGTVPVLTDGGTELHSTGATIRETMATHTHVNWVFTASGTYTLHVTARAWADDEAAALTSPTRTYTIQVGDAQPTDPSGDSHTTPGTAPVDTPTSPEDPEQPGSPDQPGSPAGPSAPGELPEEADKPRTVITSAPWGLDELAGRTALHHTHVDAGHAAWNAETGTFDVQVVNGTTPTAADSVYVRVGPDADTDGTEVSRLKVPGGKRFRFLGEPGSIVWNAPETWYHSWAPVWSGIGAGHDFPSEIDTDTITLELLGVEGPGWISVWNGGEDHATEFFSTRNPGHTRLKSPAGGHGHFNWSFEKPGRYTFIWRAFGSTKDGRAIVGPERRIEWLVGTDADLGLPEGTWTPAHPITTPAEAVEIGEPEPVDEDGETMDLGEEPSDPWEGYTCLAPGHYDLAVTNGGEWQGRKGDTSISLTGLVDGEEKSWSDWEAVVPVPDSASRTLELTPRTRALKVLGGAGTTIWTMPEVQAPNVPWVGFTTQDVDFSAIDEDGLRLYAQSFTGPGRMVSHTSSLIHGVRVHHDSKDAYSKYTFTQPTHVHLGQSFNRPGLYEVMWKYSMGYRDPAWLGQGNATLAVYYVVGDERIEQLCPGWLDKYDRPATDEGADGDGSQPGTPGNPGTPENPGTQPGVPGGDEGDGSGDGDGAGPEQPGTPGDPGTPEGPTGPTDPGHPGTPSTPGGGTTPKPEDGGDTTPTDPSTPGTPGTPGPRPGDDETTTPDEPLDPRDLVPSLPLLTPTPGTTPVPGAAPALDVCRATTIDRPATAREESLLRAGLLPAEPGAGGRYDSATTTLTFSVGPDATGTANSGHFDVGPVVVDGALAARVKDDRSQPARWLPGSALRFAVGNAARLSAPNALGFIASPGQDVWLISSAQDAHVPWVGVNSQHPGVRSSTTGTVTFRIDDVRGPGNLGIFTSGQFGSGVGEVLATGAGSSFTVPPNTHAHHNWVFTAPGTYTVTLTLSVTPTGAHLPALTDVAAGTGRVTALAGTDAQGRTLVREIVGRTASGAECHIDVPDVTGAPLAQALTAGWEAPAGHAPVLDEAGTTPTEAAQSGALGGVRPLGGAGDGVDASAEGAAAVETAALLTPGVPWRLLVGAVVATVLVQGALTFLVLAWRDRRRAGQ